MVPEIAIPIFLNALTGSSHNLRTLRAPHLTAMQVGDGENTASTPTEGTAVTVVSGP